MKGISHEPGAADPEVYQDAPGGRATCRRCSAGVIDALIGRAKAVGLKTAIYLADRILGRTAGQDRPSGRP